MDPKASKGRLLFAEDEVPFRDATAALLRKQGYECVAVGTVEEAIRAARKESYDLLLMDIRMPGNDGLDLGRKVKEISQATSVIVITAYPSTETAIEGIDLAVDAYLVKPVTFEEILEKVEGALRARASNLAQEKRTGRLEQGFRELALRLESLGHSTGLLGGREISTDIPELQSLSARELEVLTEVLHGYRVATIAEKLLISPYTVRNHLRAIFQKLGVRSQSELLAKVRPISAT